MRRAQPDVDLKLKKFNMNQIVFRPEKSEGPIIALIGGRGTGKSFLVEDLLSHFTHIPFCLAMSGTEISNGMYSAIMPKQHVFNEYNSNLIDGIVARQLQIKTANANAAKAKKPVENTDSRVIVIMDDCLFDSSWSREKVMRMIFMNGRHWNVMLIVTMQYPMGMPPTLRSNIDYAFILRENDVKNRVRLYENYAGVVGSKDVFNALMDDCTENFGCLVIARTGNSNKLEDQVFWYKAEKRPPFKLCAENYWAAAAAADAKAARERGQGRAQSQSQHKHTNPNKPTIRVTRSGW